MMLDLVGERSVAFPTHPLLPLPLLSSGPMDDMAALSSRRSINGEIFFSCSPDRFLQPIDAIIAASIAAAAGRRSRDRKGKKSLGLHKFYLQRSRSTP